MNDIIPKLATLDACPAALSYWSFHAALGEPAPETVWRNAVQHRIDDAWWLTQRLGVHATLLRRFIRRGVLDAAQLFDRVELEEDFGQRFRALGSASRVELEALRGATEKAGAAASKATWGVWGEARDAFRHARDAAFIVSSVAHDALKVQPEPTKTRYLLLVSDMAYRVRDACALTAMVVGSEASRELRHQREDLLDVYPQLLEAWGKVKVP